MNKLNITTEWRKQKKMMIIKRKYDNETIFITQEAWRGIDQFNS